METKESRGPGPRSIYVGMAALLVVAGFLYLALATGTGPPPKDIAGDPFLVTGREAYLSRCISCHGEAGHGDGPIARGLTGPKPRDFAGESWKYGEKPEQALNVVVLGIPNTSMPGWKGTFSPEQLRAVTGYVYHLAGKPVPDTLRKGDGLK